MNKKEFLNTIHSDNESELSNIFEKIILAERTGSTVYTNEFYTPNIWRAVIRLQEHFGIYISSSGIFENSERHILAFSSKPLSYFPIKLIRIDNSSKFDKVAHKDYMGAILSLGISRNKLGDFVTIDNECYVASCEDIVYYIASNLTTIGRCPCKVSEYNPLMGAIPDIKFDDMNIIVTSLRLDCLVSGICNVTRSKSLALISSGSILSDYVTIREKNYSVKYGEVITIRGYGKFKIVTTNGNTGRERIRLLIKKFV
ncbi:YlmH/Sll1252 family protein [Clostridium akagii]|uniref:YlmH/Sll1252 family protein n=1 Tax=Clostridium akagii TaxID=91623 RepID=UPI000479AA64|nr:YlmH/Sll1252 family protein [Clostridium akagii]